MPDFLYSIIQFVPTILVLICIVGSLLRGLMRGFRKSFILFLNYIIGLAIGIILFVALTEKIYTFNISFILPTIGNLAGVDMSSATNIEQAVNLILAAKLPDYAGLVANGNIAAIINCYTGFAVNIIGSILFLIITPFLVRTILYILYLIFLREGRRKKKMLEEGEEYRRHRLFGMLVGVVRGLTAAILSTSIISSLYFVVAGGNYYNSSKDAKDVDVLNQLLASNVDFSRAYNAIKLSRKSGVGLVFDIVKIGGEPIDYLLNDLVLTSKVQSFKKTENGKTITVKLNLRKELASIVGMFEDLIESGAFEPVETDGQMTVNVHFDVIESKLDEDGNETNEVLINLTKKINSSVLLSDIVPLAVVGAAEAINDGSFAVDDDVKKYFTTDLITELKELDYANDLSKIVIVAAKALTLAPKNEEGKLDVTNLNSLNEILKYVTNLDQKMLDSVCTDLSQITLITKAVAPLTTVFLNDILEKQLPDADVEVLSDGEASKPHLALKLSNVDWALEIKNLASIISGFGKIGLDYDKLLAKDEDNKSLAMEYLIEIANNDDPVDENGKHISDRLANWVASFIGYEGSEDGSYLFGQIAVNAVKYGLSKVKLKADDTKTLYDRLHLSLENYDAKLLRADLEEIFGSCLSLVPLYQTISGVSADTNYIKILKDLPIENIRKALVGSLDETENYVGGIYDLNIFKAKDELENDINLADEILREVLKSYGEGIITNEDIAKVADWHKELIALVDSIEAIQEIEGIESIDFNGDKFLESLPEIPDGNVDKLTEALSDSMLAKGLINSKFISAIDNIEALQCKDEEGNVISWADNKDVVWSDEITSSGYQYGEINALLKAAVILARKDAEGNNVVNLDDPLPGLAKLEREDADKLTNSYVVRTALENAIDNLSSSEDGFKISIPKGLKWANTYDKDGNLIEEGELWVLMQILSLNALKDNDDKIDFNRLSKTSVLKTISREDIDKITNSEIIKASLGSNIESILKASTSSDKEFKIPENIVWENTYKEDGSLNKKGELWSLIQVLNIDALQTEDGDVDFEALSNVDNLKKLSTDGDNNDIDTLFASAIISDNIQIFASAAIDEALGENASEGISDWKEEVTSLVNIIKLDQVEGDDGGVDIDKLNDVNTLASLIKRKNDDSLDYSDVDTFAKSNVVMQSVAKKIKDAGGDNIVIVIPDSYEGKENSSKWSNVDGNYRKGEFNLFVQSLFDAKEAINFGSTEDIKLTNDNLVSAIIKMKDHESITSSMVMYATISNYLVNNEQIKIRDCAKEEAPENNEGIIIKKVEINRLFDTMRDLGIEDVNNVKVQNLIESFNEESIREDICTSNILNITVLEKIFKNDTLVVPNELKSNDQIDLLQEKWYPSESGYEGAELNKILISVCELNGNGLEVNDDDQIVTDTNKLLFSLNDESTTNAKLTRIEVVTESSVMAHTINKYINDYKENGTIKVRDEAYENNLIKASEIKLMIDSLETMGINAIDDVKASNVLNGLENSITSISNSNILNITVLEKIVKNDNIKVPAKFKNIDNSVNLNGDWYPSETKKTAESEIYKLLVAVNALELKAATDNDDQIVVNNDVILNKLADEGKIDEIYGSEVFATTISNYVLNNDDVIVPLAYQAEWDRSETTKTIVDGEMICKEEVQSLSEAINALNITFDSANTEKLQLKDVNIKTILNLKAEEIDIVTKSAIIAAKISNVMLETQSLTISAEALQSYDAYNKNEQEGIYNKDINALIKAVKNLDIDPEGNTTFNLQNLDKGLLEAEIENSFIFHTTMSAQILKNLPENTYVPMKYTLNADGTKGDVMSISSRNAAKYYLSTREICNMVEALKKLGSNDASGTEQINSESLSNFDEETIDALVASGIITTRIFDNLTVCVFPDNTRSLEFLYDSDDDTSGQKMIIIASELKALLTGLKDLGFTNTATLDSISIKSIDSAKLYSSLENSRILRATLSKKVFDTEVAVPNYDYENNKIKCYEPCCYYIDSQELVNIVKAFQAVELDFSDLTTDALGNVSINSLYENKEALLNSAIVHALMSKLIIDQNVVPSEYPTKYLRSDDKFNTATAAINEVSGTTYVSKDELRKVLAVLSKLGIKANNANSIGLEHLLNLDEDDITNISNSAILSYIFSKVLIENKVDVGVGEVAYYQAIGYLCHGDMNYYKYMTCNNANSEGDQLNMFALEDIGQMIQEVIEKFKPTSAI